MRMKQLSYSPEFTRNQPACKQRGWYGAENTLSRGSDVDGLAKVVQTIHKNGCKVMAQINHAGAAASSTATSLPVLAPARCSRPRVNNVPQKITREDIQKVIRDLAVAVRRAKQAGFDGVEIHSAHGYLLSRFYLPLANHRTDECGPGSIESCC